MLFLLSPAKSLDYETPVDPALEASQPVFVKQAQGVMDVLKHKTASELSQLMAISDKLAQLNVARNKAWSSRFTANNSRQAALAFNGDVYEGLQAGSLDQAQWEWAQQHVLILSGLYGALRPLDRLQPYRLEMGTKLPIGAADNLYRYWSEPLAHYLNARLQAQTTPVLVNLASNEYFKAVNTKLVKARVIECVFHDEKAGQYKIISFLAKRARGLLARYAIEHRIAHPEGLQAFDSEGYRFDAKTSSEEKLVFKRKESDRQAA